jgi:hypothetical protein
MKFVSDRELATLFDIPETIRVRPCRSTMCKARHDWAITNEGDHYRIQAHIRAESCTFCKLFDLQDASTKSVKRIDFKLV